MTLGIITDCTHYQTENGTVGTENHILLRQFVQLASYFEKVIIVCPFGRFDDEKVVSHYNDCRVEFVPVPLVGGNTVADKWRLIAAMPKWLKAFNYLHRNSQLVYQRFPNNLNIPGFLYFYLRRKKVFATYTGTWSGYKEEAFTYRLQRWILRTRFRGPVWVYEQPAKLGGRILGGFSPSYSEAEWEEETLQVQQRISLWQSGDIELYRFITVGTLIDYKNQLYIVKACKSLRDQGFPFVLTIVGDGPLRREIEQYIAAHNLGGVVSLAGKKDHHALRELYRQHHFVVQAPLKEGFGKVPIEGFFHGVIPIINNISMAKAMVGDGERGFLFDAAKPNDLAETLLSLPGRRKQLAGMISKGREFARSQTLEAWAKEYYETVQEYYHEA